MREIEKVLDEKEKIMWEGSPQFWPFFFGRSIITTIFGIIWMIFLIPFIFFGIWSAIKGQLWGLGVFLMPHFWIGIALIVGIPIYNALLYRVSYYAITNKRVIIQKGVIGRDFEIVDFDQITNAEVNVGVMDKMFGKNSGSILISTAGTFTYTRRGPVQKPYTISNITNPYEVFKFFKKVSHAVKTDISYPNKYRPKTNPGYNTEYSA
ncbi:hypothetical protein FJZ19_04395 [Candidatus Pacearchaeota archaeon]|nr:hypothetical protein [Candidatus Pacearchaeota archaeon]